MYEKQSCSGLYMGQTPVRLLAPAAHVLSVTKLVSTEPHRALSCSNAIVDGQNHTLLDPDILEALVIKAEDLDVRVATAASNPDCRGASGVFTMTTRPKGVKQSFATRLIKTENTGPMGTPAGWMREEDTGSFVDVHSPLRNANILPSGMSVNENHGTRTGTILVLPY